MSLLPICSRLLRTAFVGYRTTNLSRCSLAGSAANADHVLSGNDEIDDVTDRGTDPEVSTIKPPKEFYGQIKNDYDRNRLDALIQQIQVIFYVSPKVPVQPLLLEDWQILFDAPNSFSRMRHLDYLYQREHKKRRDSSIKAASKLAALAEREPSDIESKPKILPMIEHWRIRRANAFNKLKHIILPDTPIIAVDMSWLPKMGPHNLSRLSKQLQLMNTINNERKNPCRLEFVHCPYEMQWLKDNMNPKGVGHRASSLHFMAEHQPKGQFYLCDETHRGDLTDVYDKERIVILTPDSSIPLDMPNPDDVHVIGAVITDPEGPVTLAKARRLGLRHAKLPIDRYMKWRSGSKQLTLIAIMKILLDVMEHQDWAKAFQDNINIRNKRSLECHTNKQASEKSKMMRAAVAEVMSMLPLVPKRRHQVPLFKPGGRKFGDQNSPMNNETWTPDKQRIKNYDGYW